MSGTYKKSALDSHTLANRRSGNAATNSLILESLDKIEDRLVDTLQIAAEAVTLVAPKTDSVEDASAFNKKSKDFLDSVKDIHGQLVAHSNVVSNYRAYGNCSYGKERELEISRGRVKAVLAHLREIEKLDGNNVSRSVNDDSKTAEEVIVLDD